MLSFSLISRHPSIAQFWNTFQVAFRTQRQLRNSLASLPFLHSWHCSSDRMLRNARNICSPLVYHPIGLGQHRCAAFHVPGSPDMVVTHAGTKPGDPLADLICCIAFFQYQQELQQALLDEGLLIHLPRPCHFLLESCDDFVKSISFGTPAFFDDFFVPLVNHSPAGLLEDVQNTVACLISVGHRCGTSINTSEGKTEAMIHLVKTPSPRSSPTGPLMPRATLLGLLELHQGQHIGLVSSYKHLGVKAAPTMQYQRVQERQHRAISARQAFRALSTGLPQLASQRAPCMAQELGRNTLSARAGPSTRLLWPLSGALSARASTLGSSIVGLCGFPKAWHPYPRHRPGSPSPLAPCSCSPTWA